MRICSLLPSATEIVCALGLDDDLVAVTERCDYPLAAKQKPVASRDVISSGLASDEIHRIVQESIRAGRSTHVLDYEMVRAARPDLVITQDLCNVCDIGSNEVIEAFRTLKSRPHFLVLGPHTLGEMLDTIMLVGEAAGVPERAQEVVTLLQSRIQRIAKATVMSPKRPRVLSLEWMNPPMAGGCWVPEMVWLAGGADGLGRHGLNGMCLTWGAVVDYQPEVLFIQPCGLKISRTLQEVEDLKQLPAWQQLPAVQNNHVYVIDPDHFTRPGPRLVTGIEIMAELLHPDLFHGLIPPGSVVQLNREAEGVHTFSTR